MEELQQEIQNLALYKKGYDDLEKGAHFMLLCVSALSVCSKGLAVCLEILTSFCTPFQEFTRRALQQCDEASPEKPAAATKKVQTSLRGKNS